MGDMDRSGAGGSLSERLGIFVAGATWAGMAPPLRHEAQRSLLNFLGCALGVARSEPLEAALRVLRPFAGAPQAGLIGRAERLDILSASFVNAIAGNLLDYDDTHLATVIHPTAPVAPVVLALAELRGCSGAAALQALALGMEVECRIGLGVSPGHYDRGWHITATCGVFGAAAAAARLLGLSAAATADALGIAASQSAGLVENLPTAAKNVGVGNAARNGLLAALLAAEGYAASPTAIEGRLGWARAGGDPIDPAPVLEGLGSRWELLRNTYKPYPSGIVFHAVIDACLALRHDHALDPGAIRQVTVRGDALLLARGDRAVATERDARVSIHHSAAVAFLFGAAGLREYGAELVHDSRVEAFRARVRAQLDPDLPRGAAHVEATLADGRTLAATVLQAHGSEADPLSDGELEAKLRAQARGVVTDSQADELVAAVWALPAASGVGPLMAASRP